MERELVIKKLESVKENVRVNNLQVLNVNVTPQETEGGDWVRVSITLDSEVHGYTQNPDGTYSDNGTNVIFVSLFSLVSTLRTIPGRSFIGNHILEHMDAIKVILAGAKIDIIQEKVTEGEQYVNPWSDKAEPKTINHDNYYNHVVNIKLDDFANIMMIEVAKKMMGLA